MKTWAGKSYWLIGASEGLGAALARVMSASGVSLILSARGEDGLRAVADGLPGPAEVSPLDVTDQQAVTDAAARILPQVDGVVHLAGVYWPVDGKDWNAGYVTTMAQVNFLGALNVAGAVVPHMVGRDAGHFVLTGSLSGFRGLPGAIGYSASKAGVMSLAESLHCDLRGTGVQVQLANPGFIKTRLTDKNDFKMPMLMSPDKAARLMFEHMTTDNFSRSFPAPFSWVFRLGQFLPDGLYYRIFA
ncbi:SDR family NAD(P)-dependent oxidoreductase [Pseudoprimorskyibacter insulae]|uniref:Putative oxidoreductase n=1 Tax=Pseudoprimorskyibacter insulae TaxID=1695997 RepID=A0A2R8AUX6_9RHOB|nr:SDR family NAD(P)-dependent oxidoreductase [Pseudoprimorskyibacter insulae]SPF79669.1 putative oxidoreductase [Pseudoprimorskyibacter insulae]